MNEIKYTYSRQMVTCKIYVAGRIVAFGAGQNRVDARRAAGLSLADDQYNPRR